ncbi:MAG: hypothetical protein LUH15_20815 [Tannerellaceae bacterium]|nr:hypothetical protein [Tannerellaceae bacterium]
MKTFRLFGVVLMAVMLSINLTSCSDDDDDDDNSSNPLVGKWLSTNSPGNTGDYYQIVFDKNGSAKGTYHLRTGEQDGSTTNYSYTYDDTTRAFTLTENSTKVKGYYTLTFNSAKTTLSLTFLKVDGDEEALKEVSDVTMQRVATFDWYKQ